MHHNEGFIKTFLAPTAIPAMRIVAKAAGDNEVELATSDSAAIIGATTRGGTHDDSTCDVVLSEIPLVECGGAITAGQRVTADANGRAVAFDGTGNYLGTALSDGAVGKVVDVLLGPGQA